MAFFYVLNQKTRHYQNETDFFFWRYLLASNYKSKAALNEFSNALALLWVHSLKRSRNSVFEYKVSPAPTLLFIIFLKVWCISGSLSLFPLCSFWPVSCPCPKPRSLVRRQQLARHTPCLLPHPQRNAPMRGLQFCPCQCQCSRWAALVNMSNGVPGLSQIWAAWISPPPGPTWWSLSRLPM